MENARLPRYNSRWRDPCSEATDSMRLVSDGAWRREHNWCNPVWGLIDDLVGTLHTSRAAATVIVPYWPDRSWHQRLELSEMAFEVVVFPPSPDLFGVFAPDRLNVRGGVGPPKWPVVAFRLPLRAMFPAPAF
eukprot:jgi/Tetstr1/445851/TSEL_033491.t1